MEANYRFPGPETMETKIFARLTAWQNWIFQRPNAVGPEGALRSFGTGSRPTYDRNESEMTVHRVPRPRRPRLAVPSLALAHSHREGGLR